MHLKALDMPDQKQHVRPGDMLLYVVMCSKDLHARASPMYGILCELLASYELLASRCKMNEA